MLRSRASLRHVNLCYSNRVLVIRAEQMRLLRESLVDRYILELALELHRDMPEQCAAVEVKDLIRYGLQRAAAYNVTTQTAVARYIRFQLYFGRDFDVDARHAWAHPILSDSGFANDSEKMTHLTRVALEYLPGDRE